jgi:hypothetical protein
MFAHAVTSCMACHDFEGEPVRVKVNLGQRSANLTDMLCIGCWSRCRVRIHRHVPLREQPFRDIALILILLAPNAEGGQRGIHLFRELEVSDLQFKCGRQCGTGAIRTSPTGIPTFAGHVR